MLAAKDMGLKVPEDVSIDNYLYRAGI